MRYEFILLDADNTLLDFDACERHAFFCAMQNLGIVPTDSLYDSYSAINQACWKELEQGRITKNELKLLRFKRLFDHVCLPDMAEKANEYYISHLSQTAILIEGALGFVQKLSKEAKLYIITNGFYEVQTGRFADCPLIPYFKEVFISEKVGYAKPDKRFFEIAAAQIPDFHKEKALVIGDSLTSDIQGANNAGMDCIWYNPKAAPAPAHLSIDYIASNYDQILHYLKHGDLHEN